MKKISLLLLLTLLFNLVGCASAELPEGFKNKKFYADLVYILETTKHDIENKTLTHSLKPEDYDRDKFLLNFEKYSKSKLTDMENKANDLAWDILAELDLHMRIKSKSTNEELVNKVKELLNIMELNITI